jgi:pimeloyl-ACP methyl ester carboxylesterase
MAYRYAYLHGFASGPQSLKGQAIRRAFEAAGQELKLPDLNRPSFARLSHSAALSAIDDLDAGGDLPWCMVGSSFGGWLAARWAEQNPDRVHRLVLLCPGFQLAERWPVLLGKDAMSKWRDEGSLQMADGKGDLTPVHYGFYEESLLQPPRPVVPCPTLILHGTADEVVPIVNSRHYAADIPSVSLVELSDDHTLSASLARVCGEALGFFGLPAPPAATVPA